MASSNAVKQTSKLTFILILAVYLLGIFMGALDTGIVTPARTIIQSGLGVDGQTGIWMITIYTLAYAASIPVMGKLADKYGRKYVYLICVAFFGIGSLFCGLAQDFASFPLLIVARAIQAIGGGGILPVATAEFGTAFPDEKRGMALGLVGGVYGIANIFGASAGSAILDIFGSHNWQFIFYVNLPIVAFILIAGFILLPNTKAANVKKIDILGITTLTAMVLALLYGLKNISFFDFANTITNTNVYPFLIAFVVLLPVFILIERRAEDPVINLGYFKNPSIVVTLILAGLTGVILMGMIFIPQFCENALKMKAGSGGYFIIILALFSGIGAPASGNLIDKFGVKPILGFGFVASVAGALYLMVVTVSSPTLPNVIISLILIGLGMGFTMGAPMNYMMLEKTPAEESNSALATLSLVRSIGTAIAPAIMVAFLVHAGTAVQGNIMQKLPSTINVPPLPHAQVLSEKFNQLKTDPNMKDKFADINMPDLTSMQTVKINMAGAGEGNSDFKIDEDLLQMMKDSDVTNIAANTKTFVEAMFAQMTPGIIKKIDTGIQSGTDGMTTARAEMDTNIREMQKGYGGLQEAIDGMGKGLAGQRKALTQLNNAMPMLKRMEGASLIDMIPADVKAKMPKATLDDLAEVKTSADLEKKIAELKQAIAGMKARISQMEAAQSHVTTPTAQMAGALAGMKAALAGQQQGLAQMESALAMMKKSESGSSILEMMPASVKATMPASVLKDLSTVKTSRDLSRKISELKSGIAKLEASRAEAQTAQDKLGKGIEALGTAQAEMDDTLIKMGEMKAGVPGAFATAEKDYLAEVDKLSPEIEEEFQSTLNEGFKNVFAVVAISSIVGLVLLMFYKDDRKKKVLAG